MLPNCVLAGEKTEVQSLNRLLREVVGPTVTRGLTHAQLPR